MKKTFVVGVQGIEYFDNLTILPPVVDQDYVNTVFGKEVEFYPFDGDHCERIVIHTAPKVGVTDGKVVANYDYRLNITFDSRIQYEPHGTSTLYHYNKHQQYEILQDLVKRPEQFSNRTYDYSNFIQPRRWSAQSFGESPRYTHIPTDVDLVLKPATGARGIGQYLLKQTRPRGKRTWTTAIDEFLKSLRKERKVVPVEGIEVVIGKGMEKGDAEGLTSLLQETPIIEEHIKGIFAEFRLIVVGGSIVYGQRRYPRGVDNEFVQATGSSGHSDDGMMIDSLHVYRDLSKLFGYAELENKWNQDTLPSIVRLMSRLPNLVNSVDLFLTEQGKWGVFEFSPQFGMEGIDSNRQAYIHLKLLQKLHLKATGDIGPGQPLYPWSIDPIGAILTPLSPVVLGGVGALLNTTGGGGCTDKSSGSKVAVGHAATTPSPTRKTTKRTPASNTTKAVDALKRKKEK